MCSCSGFASTSAITFSVAVSNLLKETAFHVGLMGTNPNSTPFRKGISLCCFGRMHKDIFDKGRHHTCREPRSVQKIFSLLCRCAHGSRHNALSGFFRLGSRLSVITS